MFSLPMPSNSDYEIIHPFIYFLKRLVILLHSKLCKLVLMRTIKTERDFSQNYISHQETKPVCLCIHRQWIGRLGQQGFGLSGLLLLVTFINLLTFGTMLCEGENSSLLSVPTSSSLSSFYHPYKASVTSFLPKEAHFLHQSSDIVTLPNVIIQLWNNSLQSIDYLNSLFFFIFILYWF